MGTSLKGKTLLPDGANSFLYEQFLIVWKISFITLSDLPGMYNFLLRTCVTCVMGATPMYGMVKKLTDKRCQYLDFIGVSKGAKIRNRFNQVPHLTQDTNGKVTNAQQTPQTRAKRSALSQQVTSKHI